jgi:[ribosomal protein S18]-alanine N-acetyltransferase
MTANALITSIDDLGEEDLDAALALDLSAFRASEIGAGSHDAGELRRRQLEAELARPWSSVRAARGERRELLGYALFWHVVDEIHLLNVAVRAEHRRRGIGRTLVSDMLDYARAHAAARVLLEVRASNAAAIALYDSLGFSRFNVRSRYYADGEDAVEMMRALP